MGAGCLRFVGVLARACAGDGHRHAVVVIGGVIFIVGVASDSDGRRDIGLVATDQ